MSIGNDIASDCIYDLDEEYERNLKEAEKGFWRKKDGTCIHISEMSDTHLRNCIKMLERNDAFDLYLPWIVRMSEELSKRTN